MFQIAKDELNQADIKLFFHGDPSSINPSLPLEDQVRIVHSIKFTYTQYSWYGTLSYF